MIENDGPETRVTVLIRHDTAPTTPNTVFDGRRLSRSPTTAHLGVDTISA
jgi:hypothetical protein